MGSSASKDFQADLADLGFKFVQEARGGVHRWSKQRSTHLTYWVHHEATAGKATFTWEHALGEFLASIGLQVGTNDPLNQFLFPVNDRRGDAHVDFVVAEIDRVEGLLGGLDLVG